ncbi:Bacterial regulatory protein, luxR family [Rubripirellula tenax]|uniref:Bacterial regulatory protein, luxR family n=1 Tax=Rubripirellula tenax TaxID=2528015 RepID=A0A5C6EFL2_9BACT|nr:LuxR C-terminal-related transcriptional regulator [Rubripirellula tenax]TWU48573.1 Bacterial regulatory protein, luxR family [Rubripirellula tenax]
MSPSSEMIPTTDAIAIAKLLGEVAGLDADTPSRKRLLMRRLGELTGADGWLWSITYSDHSRNQPISVGVIHEGLTEEQFGGWVEASQVASPPPPEDAPLTQELIKGEHTTRTRDQLVSDADWYSNPTIQKYRIERGIDDFLYSLYPLGSNTSCSAIGLFRHVGRDRFSPRDRRLAHIILSNVEWIHSAGLPGIEQQSIPKLTPTQRIVLVHLLDGKRRSEIAQMLGIAETTAKDHTRAILRHFDVTDQLALVCKFQTGNGRDERSDRPI